MVMPHTHGEWPERFGGRWLPEERGPHSLALRTQLLKDAPGVPLWPDPEDPSTIDAVSRTPHEKFAFAPPWLIFGFLPRGSRGWWLPDDTTGVVNQVIGHAHYLPPADNGIAKLVVRQLHGMYDWDAARELSPGVGAFFANKLTGGVPGRLDKPVSGCAACTSPCVHEP